MSDRDRLGPSLHCGGSISINAHKRKLTEAHGQEPSTNKVFLLTHTRRAEGPVPQYTLGGGSQSLAEGFPSPVIYERFEELKQQSTAESQVGEGSDDSESMPIRSDDDIWMEVTGGPRKSRVYGMGEYGSKAILCSTSSEYIGHEPMSSVNIDALRLDLLTQLREEMAEENARKEAEHARREAELARREAEHARIIEEQTRIIQENARREVERDEMMRSQMDQLKLQAGVMKQLQEQMAALNKQNQHTS